MTVSGPEATSEVVVHVNRERPETLEVARRTLETSGSFVLQLHGHDTPAHVHCRLDDDLARVASLDTPNYYIESNAVTPVPIAVDTDAVQEPITGELEILTGYGSESVSIAVTITPGPPDIDVDESLAAPPKPDSSSDSNLDSDSSATDKLTAELGIQPGTVAVVALGLLSLAIATATAATIGGPVATVGIGIVVVGVVVALFLLVW